VNVEVENGEVIFTGIVRNRTERRGVYESALYTAGVSDIHDDLEAYSG
jgi:osmotically-inducible protein OsmY